MVIVGAGRIGSALASRAARVGLPAQVVRRGDALPAGSAPIVLAVRTDELADAIDAMPAHQRENVVLVQNGALSGWLASRFPGVPFTRAALYVLATGGGDEGLSGAVSPLWGPLAGPVAAWLGALGIPAEVAADGACAELEKLVWLGANGPLCERHGATVGEIATAHRDELGALFRELFAVGAAAWGARVDAQATADRLAAYSMSIPGYRASIKEWPWRNGWFAEEAQRHGVPTPLHDALTSRRT